MTFVGSAYKRGLLRVHTEHTDFLIEVETGSIVDVHCNHLLQEEDLLQILIASAGAGPDEVKAIMRKGKSTEARVRLLVDGGLVTEEEAAKARTEQAILLLKRLLAAGEAEFWYYDSIHSTSRNRVNIGITALLLEHARVKDEKRLGSGPAARNEPAGRKHAASGGQEEVERSLREELERRIEAGALEVPLLDSTASELIGLCWDDGANLGDLMERINRDLGLCAHLLRIANSAAYSPRVPITSVSLALSRLGMDKLREVVLAMIVRNRMYDVPGWSDLVRPVWHRAALRSGFAQEICRMIRAGAAKGAMMGLMLDIGKPAVLNALLRIEAERGVSLERKTVLSLVEELHPAMGALAIRTWNLPAWLEKIVSLQRSPERLDDHHTEAYVIHLAEHLARWAEDPGDQSVDDLLQLPECMELSLRPEEMQSILDQVERIRLRAAAYA